MNLLIFGNVKFIMLDANYIKTPHGYEPYYKRNYDKTTNAYPYIPQEEIEWLKNEIENEQFYYVIFSHHSLSNDFMKRGISRYPYLKDMILYEEPLHVIVTIDGKMNVLIHGMDGHYQNVTPKDIELGDIWNNVTIKPRTSTLYISK